MTAFFEDIQYKIDTKQNRMQLPNNPNLHLTYCTNIHPGESWEEVFDQLKTHVPELKRRIAPGQPFGIGLRLSAQAATQLQKADHLPVFKRWLDEKGLYVFTMNGFPYGSFHRQRVKDQVYAPDWRKEERVGYTIQLAHLLAELVPEGLDGGISTSPLSYKLWLSEPSLEEEVFHASAINLARVAAEMAGIREEKGKELHLDIEPEPDCLLENTEETIAFFNDWLFPVGGEFLAGEHGIDQAEAENILRTHIRVCYDTCHFAVEYEDPKKAIQQFRDAGILIGKVQISAALKVQLNKEIEKRIPVASKLQAFEESTYLHQVIERRDDGSLHHYSDLDEALPNMNNKKAKEWRIHYHVPIFVDTFNSLHSTQDDIVRSLEPFGNDSNCRHFEIETYTWEVLPEELKTDAVKSIEREYRWVLEHMGAG